MDGPSPGAEVVDIQVRKSAGAAAVCAGAAAACDENLLGVRRPMGRLYELVSRPDSRNRTGPAPPSPAG